MSRMIAVVALCMLGMLAAVSANVPVQTKRKADGRLVMPRPLMPRPPYICGFCYRYHYWQPFQMPCYRYHRYCVRWRWGWWHRRRCVQWRWYIEAYCCRPGILYYWPFFFNGMYMCFNTHYSGGCGGFLGNGPFAKPCLLKGQKMCGPSYSLVGSKCVKGVSPVHGRLEKSPATAMRVTVNPKIVATRPPANVKEGLMAAAPPGGIGKPELSVKIAV